MHSPSFKPLLSLGLAAVMATALHPAPAVAAEWIDTWSASPQANWKPGFVLPSNTPERLANQTVRQIARVSVGGQQVRIVLSNVHGKAPIMIGAAHIARSTGGTRVDANSDRAITFGGERSAFIAAGAEVLSDPVGLDVAPLSDVAVSLYFPQPTDMDTIHWDARQTAYFTEGDQTANAEIARATTMSTRVLLSDILVDRHEDASTVVALGDSITDGNGASMDRNTRWTDFLAERLAGQDVAVLNAGISGGRVISDGMGVSALARLERDVLSKPHVKSLVVLLGINDISWPGSTFELAGRKVPIEELMAGYRQLIARAHSRGVRVVGATLTPFEGALEGSPVHDYFNAEKEHYRQAVNRWIRSSGEFDAVVDFDAVLRDSGHPARFLPRYDSGDHLHPGDEGNRAMAAALSDDVLFGRH